MNPGSGGFFRCSACGRKFGWKPEIAGQRTRCKCGAVLLVPAMPEESDGPALAASPPVVVPTTGRPALEPPPLPKRPARPIVRTTQVEEPAMVLPLDYAGPMTHPDRPGILVAIGILSILIGIGSFLASGWASSIWWRSYSESVPPAQQPAPPPLGPATCAPYSGTLMSARGIPSPARDKIVDSIQIQGPFAADTRMLLDRLLADCGQDILPSQNADGIQTDKTFFGHPDEKIRLRTPAGGVLTLASMEAEFRGPSNDQMVAKEDMIIEPQKGGGRWSVLAIQRRLNNLHAAFPQITAMQLGFIADQLQRSPNGMPYVPSIVGNDYLVPQVPVRDIALGPGGVLSVAVNNFAYWIMPDGRAIDKMHEPTGLNSLTGAPLTRPRVSFTPLFPGDYHLMLGLLILCIASALLGLFLVVAGIRALVQPAIGIPMHCWFMLIKPIMLATELLLSVMLFDSMSTPGQMARSRFNVAAGQTGLAATTVVQLIYPVALLICFLSADQMRKYVQLQGGYIGLFPPGLIKRLWLQVDRLMMNPLIRWTCILLAILMLGLTALHAWAGYQVLQQTVPIAHILAVACLSLIGLVLLRFALRKRIGAGQ